MEREQGRETKSYESQFRRRFNGEARHTETGEVIAVNADYEEEEMLSLTGVYEHYKSTPESPKLYYVGKLVYSVETGECLVLYIPLYETDDELVSARPLSVFIGSVIVNGDEVPRFRLTDKDI